MDKPGSRRAFTRLTVLGLVSAGICGSLGLTIAETKFTAFDVRLLDFVVDHRTGWLTGIMRIVTWLGSRWILAPLIILVGGFFVLRRRDWRPGTRLAAALVGGFGVHMFVRHFVERPRPPARFWIDAYTGSSFPSLHATLTIAVYGMLSAVLCANQSPGKRTLIWSLAALVTLVVGASRVYLGAHWPTDVLGGYALGTAWLSFLVATPLVWMPIQRP
ncbi:MAG TPA: phosphatase PAP2 family protein [Candidatus Nitrosopolaris sp.]|nr:phosphatase PAP2 family protein [Candidatus Nitrosopolaris sp.]